MRTPVSVVAALAAASMAALIAATEVHSAGSEQTDGVLPNAGDFCQLEVLVLGAGQDAGAPQIGNTADDGPVLWASSLALIDRAQSKRYLFDASPDITGQLRLLDRVAPQSEQAGLGVDGVFLTHAHIGHYMGLAFFGKEAANAKGVRVHAMPRMAEFLRANGPWSQLVADGNIALTGLKHDTVTDLPGGVRVQPILVPHRDEYSETVGFEIMTQGKSALYLPDLDSWDDYAAESGSSLEQLIARVNFAFVDATFWDDNELKGRDMSAIPHPRVAGVMDRLQSLPATDRAKVHFIHYNHTNPIRDPASAHSLEVIERGFNVARRGSQVCLSDAG